jgi:hypothetical protein
MEEYAASSETPTFTIGEYFVETAEDQEAPAQTTSLHSNLQRSPSSASSTEKCSSNSSIFLSGLASSYNQCACPTPLLIASIDARV